MIRSLFHIFISLLFLVGFTYPALNYYFDAQVFSVDNPDIASNYFGYTSAISGDGTRVAIGHYSDNTVKIYKRTGEAWTYETTIGSPNYLSTGRFGYAISLDSTGTYLVIGAPYETDGSTFAGRAYVYLRTGTAWALQYTYKSPTRTKASAYYGSCVDLSSDGLYAVIGSVFGNGGGITNAGHADIFLRSGVNWAHQTELISAAGESSGSFGEGCALDSTGATVAIGAWREEGGAVDAGKAYVFTRSGTAWTERSVFTSSTPTASGRFGRGIDISADGSHVIVSAPYETFSGGTNAGNVYLFKATSATSWSLLRAFTPGDATQSTMTNYTSGYFGSSVNISGDDSLIVIGSTGAGTIYPILGDGTTYRLKNHRLATYRGSTFPGWQSGENLSSDGQYFVGGAYTATVSGTANAGVVYILKN